MNLFGKSLSSLKEYSADEIDFLLQLSMQLKREKQMQTEKKRLMNKNIVLLFEKPSTRTRCAFEVAAYDQGANVTYLNPADSHIGYKESIKDTARVLSRYYDGIEFRGFLQTTFDLLQQHATIPVWNGLTDLYHPTQALADLLTMYEHSKKPFSEISFCFLGDGRSNVATSLIIAAQKMQMDCRIAAPKNYFPTIDTSNVMVTENAEKAVKNCDFLYTDVWVSMGEDESFWKTRIEEMSPYQVNQQLMRATDNAACKFMHCLPAFHNRDTEKGEAIFKQYGLSALEVTEDVFESAQSIVFDQAENRMHTIKAILVATLVDNEKI
jgi:ornithine carbamoyltransferase